MACAFPLPLTTHTTLVRAMAEGSVPRQKQYMETLDLGGKIAPSGC